jgi:hypothetical protein
MRPTGEWVGRFAALRSVREWLSRCTAKRPAPGAAVLVRKEAVRKAGGFAGPPEAVFRRLPGTVAFSPGVPYRLCVPHSWNSSRALAARTGGWVGGALETAIYPLAFIGWWLGAVDTALLGVALLIAIGMGIVISMAAVVLWELTGDEECDPDRLAMLFLAAIPENLGYRQVRNLWLFAARFAPAGR